jgi:uncharacterized membrane protein
MKRDPYDLIAQTLRFGGLASFILLLAGMGWTLALSFAQGATPPSSLRDPVSGALHGNILLLHAGLFALIATPIVRLLAALWAFAQQRDRRFTRIALFVLAVVFCSILLSFGPLRSS